MTKEEAISSMLNGKSMTFHGAPENMHYFYACGCFYVKDVNRELKHVSDFVGLPKEDWYEWSERKYDELMEIKEKRDAMNKEKEILIVVNDLEEHICYSEDSANKITVTLERNLKLKGA
jgi:hypothetical protein